MFSKNTSNNENIFCTHYEGRREVNIFDQFSKLVRDSDYATYFKFFEKLRKGFENRVKSFCTHYEAILKFV